MRLKWLVLFASVSAWCSVAPAGAIEPYLDRKLEVEGVAIRLQVLPRNDTGRDSGVMGEQVDLQVDVERMADGQPLSNLPIGVWLDSRISPLSGAVPVCGQRVASFLSGGLLARPLLDLTGHWVMTLDHEGSVSVLDPAVRFAGRSSLHSAVQLGARPADWLKTVDDALMFVALPARREVAVIDLRGLTLKSRITLAGRPSRLGLQPDGRLLWVAYHGEDDAADGVAAIDINNNKILQSVTLPSGHHELAFREDSRYVYITSRTDGALSVIDTALGEEVKRTELGGQPLSVLVLGDQKQVWVVDGAAGVIHRLDERGEQLDRIALEPGLGPARVTPDGRHVLVVNPAQHRVAIVDAAGGRLLENVTVSGRPYDIMFSELYAYVRTLDIEQVAIFPVARLPKVDMQYLPVGASALSAFPGLTIASTMTPTLDRNGAYFVSPSEKTLFHYMEGMNAPDSSVRAFGHTPMAVTVVQRGLRETAKGRYTTSFRLPSAGKMVLALVAEAPRIRECVGLEVARGDQPLARGVRINWLGDPLVTAAAGKPLELMFRVENDGAETTGRRGDRSRTFVARVVPGNGGHAERWPVIYGGDGNYVIRGSLPLAGGYYVHVESQSPETIIDAMNAPAALIINDVVSAMSSGSIATGHESR